MIALLLALAAQAAPRCGWAGPAVDPVTGRDLRMLTMTFRPSFELVFHPAVDEQVPIDLHFNVRGDVHVTAPLRFYLADGTTLDVPLRSLAPPEPYAVTTRLNLTGSVVAGELVDRTSVGVAQLGFPVPGREQAVLLDAKHAEKLRRFVVCAAGT